MNFHTIICGYFQFPEFARFNMWPLFCPQNKILKFWLKAELILLSPIWLGLAWQFLFKILIFCPSWIFCISFDLKKILHKNIIFIDSWIFAAPLHFVLWWGPPNLFHPGPESVTSEVAAVWVTQILSWQWTSLKPWVPLCLHCKLFSKCYYRHAPNPCHLCGN